MLNQSQSQSRNISPYLCTNHRHKVKFSLCASMYKTFYQSKVQPCFGLIQALCSKGRDGRRRDGSFFVFCINSFRPIYDIEPGVRTTQHSSARRHYERNVGDLRHWLTVWPPRIDEWQREMRYAKCVIPYRQGQNMARQQRQIWSLFRGSYSAEKISPVVFCRTSSPVPFRRYARYNANDLTGLALDLI